MRPLACTPSCGALQVCLHAQLLCCTLLLLISANRFALLWLKLGQGLLKQFCKLQGLLHLGHQGAPPRLYCTPAGCYSLYGQLFLMPVEVVVKSLFTLQPGGALNTPASLFSNSSVSEQQQARRTGAQ